MTRVDRDRLGVALGVSLVAHVLFGVLAGLFSAPPALPDYLPPIIVELDPPEEVLPEPPPEPPPEPEVIPPEESETVAPATSDQVAPAATSGGAPEAVVEDAGSLGGAGGVGGRQSGAQREGSAQRGADPMANAPPRDFSLEELYGRESSDAPRRRSGSEDVLQPDPESVAADVALPDWAGTVLSDAGVSADQMSVSEATSVAERLRDSEFERMLTDAIAGVRSDSSSSGEAAPGAQEAPATGTPGGDGASEGPATASPGSGVGDRRITWQRGERGSAGRLPDLTAADFGGRVPAETLFVVIFEVDEGGRVVPGSIILQRRSVHTAANEKIRRAIASWRFQAKPGAQAESAVFTLVVRREDLD